MYRTRAVREQQREVRDFAGLAGFGDETDAAAEALANQMMMNCGNGERGRNRCVGGVNCAIAENENAAAVANGLSRPPTQIVDRWLQAADTRRDREQR